MPLRALMLLATVMLNLCIAGPVSIGLAYLTRDRFGAAATYGIMISAVAAGSLLGALLAGVWKVHRRGVMILVASLVLGTMPRIDRPAGNGMERRRRPVWSWAQPQAW